MTAADNFWVFFLSRQLAIFSIELRGFQGKRNPMIDGAIWGV
jgi:hypothetical protein